MAGLTVTETGAEIEIVPIFPEADITVPSAATATAFVSGTDIVPVAVGDRVRDTTATVPSGIVFAFKPAIKQRWPAQYRDFPADEPELPNVLVTDCMVNGEIRSHCSPAGRFPAEEVSVT